MPSIQGIEEIQESKDGNLERYATPSTTRRTENIGDIRGEEEEVRNWAKEMRGITRDERVKRRRQKGDSGNRSPSFKENIESGSRVAQLHRKGCKDSEAPRRITNLWAPLVSYRRRLSISRSSPLARFTEGMETEREAKWARERPGETETRLRTEERKGEEKKEERKKYCRTRHGSMTKWQLWCRNNRVYCSRLVRTPACSCIILFTFSLSLELNLSF